MGHGDEIVLADAHFPSGNINDNILRADGIKIPDLLKAILPLFELDAYVSCPVFMMDAVQGDKIDPLVEEQYLKAIHETNPRLISIERLERFAFYERAKKAYCVLITGELSKYGNIILKKGVTPV
jgi:L-fucose mutarotase